MGDFNRGEEAARCIGWGWGAFGTRTGGGSLVEAVAVVATHACNPSTWRLRQNNFCEFKGNLIYSEFQASLGSNVRPCVKKPPPPPTKSGSN